MVRITRGANSRVVLVLFVFWGDSHKKMGQWYRYTP